MKMLSGPIVEPSSPPAKQLIILLHGYGASGEDLISLAPLWQTLLPEAVFVAPHGLQRCELGGGGYQWFSLPDLAPKTLEQGIEAVLPSLHTYLDTIVAQYKIAENQVALVGFSQGAMLALALGLSCPQRLAGIVAYSGALVYPDNKPVIAKPQVLMVHGDKDEMVPFACLAQGKSSLEKRGVPVTSFVCQNVGHGIDYNGIQVAGAFLSQQFETLKNNTISHQIREEK